MPRHIKVESLCIFCRNALDFYRPRRRNQPDVSASDKRPWQTDVLCFFEIFLEEPQDTARPIVFRTTSNDRNWKHPNNAVRTLLEEGEITLCNSRRCLLCNPGDPAHFCHVACAQLAKTRLDLQRLDGQFLCQIARLICPMVTSSAMSLVSVRTNSCPPMASDLPGTTTLRALLYSIEVRLPTEMRVLIFGFTTGLFKALTEALITLNYITCQHVTAETALSWHQPFSQTTTLAGFRAETIDLFGESYLKRIVELSSLELHVHDDAILMSSESSVQGLQVSVGTYGLLDVRIVYRNGSFSNWTSNRRRDWITTFAGDDLRKLSTLSNGVWIASVRLEADHSSSNSNGHVRLFFDHETPILLGKQGSYIDVNESGTTACTGLGPGARLARYLPLDNVRSLTMFCSSTGVSCIQTNEDSRLRLGATSSYACAVTHSLRPGEYPKSLHVLTRGFPPPLATLPTHGPSILIKTSSDRDLYFGTQVFPYMGDAHSSNLGTDTERLLGLFNDPTSNTSESLGCIGAVYETPDSSRGRFRTSTLLPELTPIEVFSFFGIHGHVAYFNSAHFRDVKTLELQKDGERCTGMKITRHSSLVDILGQWDPTAHMTTSMVYASYQGPLDTLTFVLSRGCEADGLQDTFLKGVFTYALPDSEEQTLVWNDPHKEVAWWFTPSYDHIELYEQSFSEIELPVDSRLPPVIVE